MWSTISFFCDAHARFIAAEPGFEFVSDNSLFQKHQTVDECPSKASLSQIPLGPHVKTTHVCEDMLDDVPVGTVVLRQQPDVEKDVRTVLSSRFYKVKYLWILGNDVLCDWAVWSTSLQL